MKLDPPRTPPVASPSIAPLIGVTGNLEPARGGSGGTGLDLSLRYAEAVVAAGGIPVAVTYLEGLDPELHAAELIARLDGLLFSGGDDFATEPLGLGATHPSASPVPALKQDTDLALARSALAGGLPVLGICYGCQLLGLAEGATLFQHLPEDRPPAQPHTGDVSHRVCSLPGTKLAGLLGVGEVDAVSRHHQALRSIASPWTISATDGEGLIEAIERRDHPFALGVQWHPELPDPTFALGSPHGRLLVALVEAARAHRAARLESPEPIAPAAPPILTTNR